MNSGSDINVQDYRLSENHLLLYSQMPIIFIFFSCHQSICQFQPRNDEKLFISQVKGYKQLSLMIHAAVDCLFMIFSHYHASKLHQNCTVHQSNRSQHVPQPFPLISQMVFSFTYSRTIYLCLSQKQFDFLFLIIKIEYSGNLIGFHFMKANAKYV